MKKKMSVEIDVNCCEVSLRFLLVMLKLAALILRFEKIIVNDMFQLFEPKESPSVQQGALCKPWVGVFMVAETCFLNDTWILENNRRGCCQGSVVGHENKVTQSSAVPASAESDAACACSVLGRRNHHRVCFALQVEPP